MQKKLFQRETITDIYPEHYIIKVNEFDDIAKDTLDKWVYFLKNSEIKDEFNAKGIAEAREKLKEINLPKEELPAYRRFQENLSLEANIAQTIRFEMEFEKEKAHLAGHEEGLEEGKKEGLEEGKKTEREEIAKCLKIKGMDFRTIQDVTGLSSEEIEKL